MNSNVPKPKVKINSRQELRAKLGSHIINKNNIQIQKRNSSGVKKIFLEI